MEYFTAEEVSQLFFGSNLTKREIFAKVYERYISVANEYCLQYGVYRNVGMDIYEKTIQHICYMTSNGLCQPKEFNRMIRKSLDNQFKKEIKFIDTIDEKIDSADRSKSHDISMLYVLNFCKELKHNPELAKQLNITEEDIAVVYAKFGINISKSTIGKEKNSNQIAKSTNLTEREVVAKYVATINKIKAYVRNNDIKRGSGLGL